MARSRKNTQTAESEPAGPPADEMAVATDPNDVFGKEGAQPQEAGPSAVVAAQAVNGKL